MDWKLRAKVFLQRLWQPTCACMTCMSAPSFVNVVSAVHWKIALQTGVGTGILALLLTLTPVGRLFGHRYGNALMVGGLTVLEGRPGPLIDGSAYSPRSRSLAARLEKWSGRRDLPESWAVAG